MPATGIYQQLVLDHHRAPRNFGRLADHTHSADGINALCGDTLHIELCFAHGRIEALRFCGESCAITTATASMLSERVRGMNADDIIADMTRFERLLHGEIAEDAALGPLNAFGELSRYPARRKCAMLPWATLCAALAGKERTSTETEPA